MPLEGYGPLFIMILLVVVSLVWTFIFGSLIVLFIIELVGTFFKRVFNTIKKLGGR